MTTEEYPDFHGDMPLNHSSVKVTCTCSTECTCEKGCNCISCGCVTCSPAKSCDCDECKCSK